MKQGQLYIVSAPSGAGKTSLLNALRGRLQYVTVSLSHTTRSPRPGEKDGWHYRFVSVDEFRSEVDKGHFLEYAEVFGNYYGTSKLTVQEFLDAGKDVILEIDWQGAQQVRNIMPEALSIFILPPSKAALRSRLEGRGQDSEEIVARRMSEAESESSHYDEYNYLIVNDDFEQARQELCAIFFANRLEVSRQSSKYKEVLTELLSV